MKTTTTAATSLGPIDALRRERLINLADIAAAAPGKAARLPWPTRDELLTSHRDIGPTPTLGRGAVALADQLVEDSAILRAGAQLVSLREIQKNAFPGIDRTLKAGWGTSPDVAPDFALTESTPRRLSAYIVVSSQLLRTSPVLAGDFIERQLLSAISAALDDAGLNADGTAGTPTGLLADTAVAERVLVGANPALADVLAMEAALPDHGDPAARVWLADSATRSTMRSTARSAGLPLPLWTDGPVGGPLGYRGFVSRFAPAATLIFGRFSDLLIVHNGDLEIFKPMDANDGKLGVETMFVSGFFDVLAVNPETSFIRATPAP